MDRREFFTLTSAVVAGAAMPKAGLGESLSAAVDLHGPIFLPANGAPGGARQASVKNTSEFMEDYTGGQPLNVPSRMFPATQTPYMTRQGREQFFTYFNWSGKTGVNQVHRVQGGVTGWELLSNPMGPDGMVGPRFVTAAWEVPQAAVVPGVVAGDGADSMWLYRTASVWKGPIGPDGTLSNVRMFGPKKRSRLLTEGQQPAGTRYLVEIVQDLNAETGGAPDGRPQAINKYGVILRDVNPNLYPMESYFTGADAFSSIQAGALEKSFGRQIFPLRDVGDGFYRCVTLTDQGDVYSVLVVLDRSRPNWPTFQPKEKTLLGHTAMGCVYVVEHLAGDVEVLIFDLPGVTSVKGTYQPGSRQGAEWMAPVRTQIVAGELNVHDPERMYWMDGAWNAAQSRVEIFVMVRDQADPTGKMDVWGTWRGTDGQWDSLRMIERDCTSAQAYDAQRVALLVGKPGTGYEILLRNAKGIWESEYVRLPLPPEGAAGTEPARKGGMAKIGSYRVGINLSSQGVPMGGQTLRMTASAQTQAVLQGDRYVVLSTVRETEVMTDSSGVAWVNVLLQERMCFPTVYLKSDCFAGQLKLDLNKRVEDFFVNLTPDQLMNAKDKETGQRLVSNPQNLDAVVSGIKQMMQVQKQQQSRLEPPPGERWQLESDVHAHWVPVSLHGRGLRQALVHDPTRCWSLEQVNGTLIFQHLTRDEAELRVIALRTLHASFFSDLLSDVSDLASAAWSGVCNVVAAVVSGAQMVVHVVINGITSVLTVVLHTVEQLMNAVTLLLDAAGFVLGMAVNWLLEQLGFAFDWKGIKHRRDLLRTVVEHGADKLTQVLPDPLVGAKYLAGELDEVRKWLLQYRSNPNAGKSFGGGIESLPSLPDVFSLSGKTVLPQVTWLLDKVKDKLLSAISGPDAPEIEGFAKVQTTMFLKVAVVGDSLNLSMGDLESMVLEWASNGDLFASSSMQGLLDPLLAKLDTLIALLEDLILVAAEALHELWAHPRKIVEWLDSKIEIPFVSGFYRGLTGNDLSLFDVACLLAAIPGSVHGVPMETPRSMQVRRRTEDGGHLQLASLELGPRPAPLLLANGSVGADDRTELQTLGAVCASLFMGIGIFTATIDATMIASGGGSDAVDAMMVSRINLGVSVFAGLSMVFAGGVWEEEVAIPVLLAAGGVIFFKACPWLDRKAELKSGRAKGWIGDLLLVGLNSYFFGQSIKKGDDKAIAYNAIGLVEVLAIGIVREATAQGKKIPQPYPLVFGGVIGAMRVAKEGLYISNSFSS
jgi:hypothetical protein